MLLDDHCLLGEVGDLFIAQAEARTVGRIDVDSLDRLAGLGFVAIDHFDRLAAQIAAQDSRATSFQRLLVDVELVRVDRTLHHGFAKAVGAGDEDHITEARFGVEGEHHTGGAGFRADHALYTGRQGDQLVIETLVHAVGNGTVVEQRGEHFLGRADHVVHATDVEEGFLLAGKGRVRKVFGGGRGADRDGHVVVAAGHFGEGRANVGIELRRELGVHDPLADLRAGLGQGVDVIHVEGIEQSVDLIVQTAEFEEVAIGLSRRGETARYGNAGTGEVADHLAQGGVLAPYTLNVMIAELIEGNYVLYQGDLSTLVLETQPEPGRTTVARPCKISNNARQPGSAKGLL